MYLDVFRYIRVVSSIVCEWPRCLHREGSQVIQAFKVIRTEQIFIGEDFGAFRRLIYTKPETPDSCTLRTVQQKLCVNLDVFRCF